MTEFQAWPKIPRLNRECIVTEKIDGTNAAVIIEELGTGEVFDAGAHDFDAGPPEQRPIAVVQIPDERWFGIWAQSRKRLLQTNEDGGKGSDNFGFAAWVKENAVELAAGLGEGRHFGEWWGQGIQRGYGLDHKRFSLFNAGRWHDKDDNGIGESVAPGCCYVVPVLTTGSIISAAADGALALLSEEGSHAVPGFDDPEGIVVYHTAARSSFKVTFDQDELPKSLAQSAEAVA